jgi:biopolymer transport protein ExbB
LIGLLGTLVAASRALSTLGVADNSGPTWGPALATALGPLIAGVAIGILALVAYDGLVARVEGLAAALDRVAAETIDAVAMALPPDLRPGAAGGPARTPHQIRVEIPSPGSKVGESEEDHD